MISNFRGMAAKLIAGVLLALAVMTPALASDVPGGSGAPPNPEPVPVSAGQTESVGVYRNFKAAVLFVSDYYNNCVHPAMRPVSAETLPDEPELYADFEAVWDYAAATGADRLAFHYPGKQSVNSYHKYETVIKFVSMYYRYVHPEDLNYMRLKEYTFVEDEGSRYGFTLVLEFEDQDSSVKREYRAAAAEKAEELYLETAARFTPEMSQRERAALLCQAVADKVEYKNDYTGLCHTAYCALVNGYAVCDGYTAALNLLLRLDGIECEGCYGDAKIRKHEWTRAKLDGEWVNIDATWYDGGNLEYAEMTDEEIAVTHKLDMQYRNRVGEEESRLAAMTAAEAARKGGQP